MTELDRMPEGGISDVLGWTDPLALSPVTYDGIRYECMEAAYQAQKTADAANRVLFMNLEGADALRLGSLVFPVRRGWASVRHEIMVDIVLSKVFASDLVMQADLESALADVKAHDGLAALWKEAFDSFKAGGRPRLTGATPTAQPTVAAGGTVVRPGGTGQAARPMGKPVGSCPWCGRPVTRQGKYFMCTNEECGGKLPVENKYLHSTVTEEAARILFAGGTLSSKGKYQDGTPYTVDVRLSPLRDSEHSGFYSFEKVRG